MNKFRLSRPVTTSLAIAVLASGGLLTSAGAATNHLTAGPNSLPSTTLVPAPPAGASGPDDITNLATPGLDGGKLVLWTEFQNGVGPDGSPGPGGVTNSTVAGYDASTGALVKTFSLAGHVDGLTADPALHDLIATTNEDNNSSRSWSTRRPEPSSTIPTAPVPPPPATGGPTASPFSEARSISLTPTPTT